jgi:hypothetical protein
MTEPFSVPARLWESKAKELRDLAGCTSDVNLDPWLLAPKVGLTLLDGHQALALASTIDRQHLTGIGSRSWSGGVFAKPLPDGTHLCILNPNHPMRRNKVTLMEEITHKYLGHQPTSLSCESTAARFRSFDSNIEKEAYGIGAAALVPWFRLFRLVNAGHSSPHIAEGFEVTPELVEYRIKITGAYRLYAARQRIA